MLLDYYPTDKPMTVIVPILLAAVMSVGNAVLENNDGITARVSSGEMIINQADQKRLYDSIHTGGVGGGSVRSSISGEQIVIAVNNWARRTNHGELVFAGRG